MVCSTKMYHYYLLLSILLVSVNSVQRNNNFIYSLPNNPNLDQDFDANYGHSSDDRYNPFYLPVSRYETSPYNRVGHGYETMSTLKYAQNYNELNIHGRIPPPPIITPFIGSLNGRAGYNINTRSPFPSSLYDRSPFLSPLYPSYPGPQDIAPQFNPTSVPYSTGNGPTRLFTDFNNPNFGPSYHVNPDDTVSDYETGFRIAGGNLSYGTYSHNRLPIYPTLCHDLGSPVNGGHCCSGTNGPIDESGINKCCLVAGSSCGNNPDKCCNNQVCTNIGNPAAGVFICADPS